MFTRMQKYQKALLISVTVLIAASFGMGSLFMNLADPGEITKWAVFGDKKIKISQNEFRQAREQWHQIFQLARLLSVKSQKIQKIRQGEDFQSFQHLFYVSDNVWDDVYSLREDVAMLDRKLDDRLNNPMKWQALIEGTLDFMGGTSYPPKMEELDFYYTLPEEERAKVESNLPETDVWNFILMTHEANEWGIQVATNEIQNFISATRSLFSSPREFEERLKNLNIHVNSLDQLVKRALIVVKYLQARHSGLKIPTETVYKTYTDYNSVYQLQYFTKDFQSFMPAMENYEQERDAFFDIKSQEDPTFFQLPALASFDYIKLPANAFEQEVEVAKEEVQKLFTERNIYIDDELDDVAYAKKVEEEKGKIEKELRLQKSERKALVWLSEVRNKLSSLGLEAPMAKVAEQFKLEYKSQTNISENDFFEGETQPQDAKKYLYQIAKIGDFSDVCGAGSGKDKVFYVFRLTEKQDVRLVTKEEIAKDDSLFLQCYYERNKSAFELPERYRLYYVMTDYDAIANNLLVTSKAMKDFYEQYKDQLYKKEGEVKEGENPYMEFQDVQENLKIQVTNYLRIRELQKIQIVHRLCQDKGADMNVELVVKDAAKQIMLAPAGLMYFEDEEFRSKEDIRKNNPVKDKNFADFKVDEGVSEIKDAPRGKYFYRIIEKETASKPNFFTIQDKIKEHFLKKQAEFKAQIAFATWKEEYDYQIMEAKRRIAKISDEKARAEELVLLPNTIFQLLAISKQAKVITTPTFGNIHEVEELANISEMNTVLHLEVGEMHKPIVDNNQVYLVQLLSKRIPSLHEFPITSIERIRNILTQRAYRSGKLAFLDHKRHFQSMNFAFYADNYGGDLNLDDYAIALDE
ncbi:MAG TPA: hypothetical protein P5543_00080 [Planctomycetota bacterium]|nr:hypothetical protein [Planctomycetota bacterium]HRU50580.1 hypothetical protein [Planctomycetota bacterium]